MKESYTALTTSVVQSPETADKVICQLARVVKGIKLNITFSFNNVFLKGEMKSFCSSNRSPILQADYNALKDFSWEEIWQELVKDLPALMKLLTCLIPEESSRPLLCLVALMLLKKRCSTMSLIQREISVLFMVMEFQIRYNYTIDSRVRGIGNFWFTPN